MAEFDSMVQRKQCLLIQVQDRVAHHQSQIHILQSFLLNGHAHDDVFKAKIDTMIQHGLLLIQQNLTFKEKITNTKTSTPVLPLQPPPLFPPNHSSSSSYLPSLLYSTTLRITPSPILQPPLLLLYLQSVP